MPWEIIFPQAEQPKTLENFLKKRFPIGYVRKLFQKNGVRVNGERSGPNDLARPGDKIHLYIPFEARRAASETRPAQRGFEVVFENDLFLVVNKEARVAVHEGKNVLKRDSLLGKLERSYRPQGITPRLVHRIDRDTSGLLLVAKKEEVAEELQRRFEEGGVDKEYIALVAGKLHPKKGAIEFPLPGREGKMVSALTLYKVEKEFPGASLARVEIKTGRMHQIRLHFARLGHPLVMDDEHGDFAFNKRFRKTHGLKRQFLHASALALEYRGKKWKWTVPLAEDLSRTLRSLQSG